MAGLKSVIHPCSLNADSKHEPCGSDAMNIQNSSRYHEVHARSLRDPEGFWGEAAREIDWIEPAKKVFDPAMGLYGRWFAGAVVNTCYNALDRHVANGRADQVALIHDSPLANLPEQALSPNSPMPRCCTR